MIIQFFAWYDWQVSEALSDTNQDVDNDIKIMTVKFNELAPLKFIIVFYCFYLFCICQSTFFIFFFDSFVFLFVEVYKIGHFLLN